MDYFQSSVKENTRMLMFTASEPKRKKNKKVNNNNSISDYNDAQNGCNDYKSIIQDFFTLHFTGSASNGKFIVWQDC